MNNGEVKKWTLYSSYSVDNDAMKWFVSRDSEITPEVETPERIEVMPVEDHDLLMKEKDAKIESLRYVLEAVRSQMCWERDRDQLTMGMASLHDDVTKVLEKGEA